MPSARPRPEWRELDDDLVKTARIFVDSPRRRWRESGDVIAARSEVTITAAVVAGVNPAGERQEIHAVQSVGVSQVEDVAAAPRLSCSTRPDDDHRSSRSVPSTLTEKRTPASASPERSFARRSSAWSRAGIPGRAAQARELQPINA